MHSEREEFLFPKKNHWERGGGGNERLSEKTRDLTFNQFFKRRKIVNCKLFFHENKLSM